MKLRGMGMGAVRRQNTHTPSFPNQTDTNPIFRSQGGGLQKRREILWGRILVRLSDHLRKNVISGVLPKHLRHGLGTNDEL